jgi:hypothetical protein
MEKLSAAIVKPSAAIVELSAVREKPTKVNEQLEDVRR